LPTDGVVAVRQTRDGRLWIGTEEGLSRFDGQRWTTYDRSRAEAFRSNTVGALLEARDGALWIGTYGGGVIRLRDDAFERFDTARGLSSDLVQCLAETPDGTIWIGTETGGLSVVRSGASSAEAIEPTLREHAIQALWADADGTLWIASHGGGLYRRRSGVLEHLGAGAINALFRDRGGTLWVGGAKGQLQRIDGDRLVPGPALDPALGDVLAIADDRAGSLWIGTGTGGVVRLRGDRVERLASGASYERVTSIFEDREQNLWLATLDGLIMLRDAAFVTHDPAGPGEAPTLVWSVREDPGGDGMLLATQGRGLLRLGAGGFTAIAGLPSNVGAIEPAGGALWIGSREGLREVKDGSARAITTREGLRSDNVRAILAEPDGALWVGTHEGGLDRIAGGAVGAGGSALVKSVYALLRGRNGDVWIGGQEGLARARGGKVERVEGLADPFVLGLHEDATGALWIAKANDGIVRLRDGAMSTISKRHGLASDTVYALLEDDLGHVWMSTNVGVSRVAKAQLEAVADGRATEVDAALFNEDDGMKSRQCMAGRQPVAWKGKDGRLWFATARGASVVDPARLPRNEVPPPAALEELLVDGKPWPLRGDAVLPAGTRDVEIRYSASSYARVDRVTFRHRVDGLDDAWVAAGSRRIAHYGKLAPGDYRFRLLAANADGVWSAREATLAFRIEPYFYQRRSFHLLLGLAGLLAAAAFYRLRVRAIQARARELEEKVKVRTAELREAMRRIDEDLQQARAFQEGMLPTLPVHAAVKFVARYRPAEVVGGDVYDVHALGPDHFRVFVADATGHGVQASLRTMVLRTEYGRLRATCPTPAALLAALNRAIVVNHPQMQVRASACCFDLVGPLLRYANAAHPPLVRARGGRVDEVYLRSTFLGVVPEIEVDQIEVALEPGDRLLVYTDGLVEHGAGDAAWLGEGLAKGTLDEATDALVRRCEEQAGEKGQEDDVTLIAIEHGRAL
jgi:ligand-binding sensor domain-containing protein/serine phosphatase RsbU (regulator of sigma subunit)